MTSFTVDARIHTLHIVRQIVDNICRTQLVEWLKDSIKPARLLTILLIHLIPNAHGQILLSADDLGQIVQSSILFAQYAVLLSPQIVHVHIAVLASSAGRWPTINTNLLRKANVVVVIVPPQTRSGLLEQLRPIVGLIFIGKLGLQVDELGLQRLDLTTTSLLLGTSSARKHMNVIRNVPPFDHLNTKKMHTYSRCEPLRSAGSNHWPTALVAYE